MYRHLAPALLALLLAAQPALAGREPERHEKAEFVRLLAPAAGATLVAGDRVDLHWAAGPDLAAFEAAHEWEAFLSVDGGRSWSFRITPHLDLSRRQLSFRVPDVVSDEVRLLLRVGDEVEEREQELGGRYRIVAAPTAAVAPPVKVQPAFSRGEAARAGELGVVSWVEELEGGRLVEHRYTPTGPFLSSPVPADSPQLVACLDGQRDRERDFAAGLRPPTKVALRSASLALPVPHLARSIPILLLVRRLNE